MKELRLAEELLLLAIDEKKGFVVWYKKGIVKYGLAGAILRELIDAGKLELNDEKIKISNLDPTGDTILDRALIIMESTQKQKKVQHWISKLSKKEFRDILFEDLRNQGVLRKIEDEEPGRFFAKERFRFWFDKPIKQTQRKLHDILILGKAGDEKSMKLIGLVQACGLCGQLFKDSGERRTAKEKAKALSQEDKIRKGIKSAVNNKRSTIGSTALTLITGILKEIL